MAFGGTAGYVGVPDSPRLSPAGDFTLEACGRAGSYAAHYFNGGIDEVAIYNRALPAARVQAHYGAAISGGANPWGPIRS
jgi:hypothetical protein